MNWLPYLFTTQPEWDLSVLKRYEEGWHITFPESYKQLVARHQGKRPERNMFDFYIDNKKNTTIMGPLFHFIENSTEYKSYHIEINYLVYKDRLPAYIIPFSEDPGGFQIAFDYRKFNKDPMIVLINSDALTKEESVIYIAKDFDSFLKKLYVEQ